jgi:hypothetical protein
MEMTPNETLFAGNNASYQVILEMINLIVEQKLLDLMLDKSMEGKEIEDAFILEEILKLNMGFLS